MLNVNRKGVNKVNGYFQQLEVACDRVVAFLCEQEEVKVEKPVVVLRERLPVYNTGRYDPNHGVVILSATDHDLFDTLVHEVVHHCRQVYRCVDRKHSTGFYREVEWLKKRVPRDRIVKLAKAHLRYFRQAMKERR